ncbi:MAG: hypothetical protein IJV31_11735 [Clostridia bacterium]|nr:hypothetical protein [Clostridia bacterium]
MNRDEILSKVRKNNTLDERELWVQINSLGVSTIAIPILCLFFLLVRIFIGNTHVSDLISIIFAQLLVQAYYSYREEKTKLKLIKIIIFSIIFLIFMALFFHEIIFIN